MCKEGVPNRRGASGGEAETNDGEMRDKAKEREREIIEKQTDEDGNGVNECIEWNEKEREEETYGRKEKNNERKIESDETQLWNLKRKQW